MPAHLIRMVNSQTEYLSFCHDAAKVLASYPHLSFTEKEIPELSGTIVLKDNSGAEIDSYEVLIQATFGYPYFFPLVFETGGKIPINADWHVYESDGHLCLCTTTDEFIKTSNGLSLDEFIKEELEPYLFNQTYRRKKGFFLNEVPHGNIGQLMSLKKLLKIEDIGNIRWILQKAEEGFKMGRTNYCFCGSGIKYRHCHRDPLEKLTAMRKTKLKILRNMVESII